MAGNWVFAPFATLSSLTGIAEDQTKLVCIFVLSIVAGHIQWRWVRGTLRRHLYSVSVGLLFAVVQFGLSNLCYFLVSSVVVYAMLKVLPRTRVALPVFVFCMLFLCCTHIHRMVTDWMGWRMDETALQMILTCKMTSLAYSYQDAETMKSAVERVHKTQRALAVRELPS